MFRSQIVFQKGNYYKDDDFMFSLKTTHGFQFGWMINIGLPKHFFLQTGINYELMNLKYKYFIREGVFKNNFEVDSRSTFHSYNTYVLPIYTGYNIPIKTKKNSFFIQPKIVVDLKYGIGGIYIVDTYIGELNAPNTFLISSLSNYENNPLNGVKHEFSASFVAGIGFNYILKDQRIINFQIIGSYNPFIVDKGEMIFLPGTSQEKIVPFRNYFNSLGFEMNYLFSKRPNHVSKRKRKQMEALKVL